MLVHWLSSSAPHIVESIAAAHSQICRTIVSVVRLQIFIDNNVDEMHWIEIEAFTMYSNRCSRIRVFLPIKAI